MSQNMCERKNLDIGILICFTIYISSKYICRKDIILRFDFKIPILFLCVFYLTEIYQPKIKSAKKTLGRKPQLF